MVYSQCKTVRSIRPDLDGMEFSISSRKWHLQVMWPNQTILHWIIESKYSKNKTIQIYGSQIHKVNYITVRPIGRSGLPCRSWILMFQRSKAATCIPIQFRIWRRRSPLSIISRLSTKTVFPSKVKTHLGMSHRIWLIIVNIQKKICYKCSHYCIQIFLSYESLVTHRWLTNDSSNEKLRVIIL